MFLAVASPARVLLVVRLAVRFGPCLGLHRRPWRRARRGDSERGVAAAVEVRAVGRALCSELGPPSKQKVQYSAADLFKR